MDELQKIADFWRKMATHGHCKPVMLTLFKILGRDKGQIFTLGGEWSTPLCILDLNGLWNGMFLNIVWCDVSDK